MTDKEKFIEIFRMTREYSILSERYGDSYIFGCIDSGGGPSSVHSAWQIYGMCNGLYSEEEK